MRSYTYSNVCVIKLLYRTVTVSTLPQACLYQYEYKFINFNF
jgi:hypothetical protein